MPTGSGTALGRFLYWYLLLLMVQLEVLYLLAGPLGLAFSPRLMLWLVPAGIPIPAALLACALERARGKEIKGELTSWVRLRAALAMFVAWAGAYFLSGLLTDPERVRYLPLLIEEQIALTPSYSLLYILLYPIFFLPFFVIRERAQLKLLVRAYALMVGICTLCFWVLPIGMERPPLPEAPGDLGVWILSLVQGNDPSWNCLPSEHCAAALIAALACYEADKRVGLFALLSTFLIGFSTLFTKQHYLADIVAGYSLAVALHFGVRWGLSKERVTGPSLTSATRISALKRPSETLTPSARQSEQ